MVRRSSATELLREAAAIFDSPQAKLQSSAERAWQRGFASGGEWMREALWMMRDGTVPYRPLNFSGLGLFKYGTAIAAFASVAVVAFYLKHPWLLVAAAFAFYFVEAQMVFLFPLAIDGESDVLSRSRLLVSRAGGIWRVMRVVSWFAVTMICGGFGGRGFIRSWCLGCLAVLVWYEDLRRQDAVKPGIVLNRPKLEIGNSHPLLIRLEQLHFLNNLESVRVAYLSDLHLHRRAEGVAAELVSLVRGISPDLILLGGDLVDSKSALVLLEKTIKNLSDVAQVWAIAGNHDQLVGVNEVQNAVEKGSGNWLGEGSVLLRWPRRKPFYLDGKVCEAPSDAWGRILCLHNPSGFPAAVTRNYSLVLAGHLHGGQFVLKERNGTLYPGAFVYRWNGLRFKQRNSVMLVSRGVSDTLPVRWNCPREILLCEIS